MAKQFTPAFSAFVNIELTNTFSSQDGWGDLRLEEAWLQYRHSSALRIHVGLQIPDFNNLNTIKNRTPLLPYIIRPLAYESSFRDFVGTSNYIPEHSFVRVSGTQPVGDVRLDYVVHLGNQEAFVTAQGGNTYPSGTDVSLAKAYGGRVGARYRGVKVGVSATSDSYVEDSFGIDQVDRYRLGADLSFTIQRLLFESEVISVENVLSDAQQRQFERLSANDPLAGSSLDRRFYYVMLGYYLAGQWLVYSSISQIYDLDSKITADGITFWSVGGTFKPLEQVVLKIQYLRGHLDAEPIQTYSGSHLLAAVSVLF
ncbi:MAG: hypothetical protein AAF730_10415 [Bacteroidota bacterium]